MALSARQSCIVTTQAVLCEIGNYFSRVDERHLAIALIDSYEHDPSVTIVPVSDALYQRGFALYRARLDQDWSLTDCISFVVMDDEAILDGLTHDKHFEQNGGRALLRDTYYDVANRPTY